MFDLNNLAASPLSFNYPISASVSIATSVSGDARQNAAVSVVYGSVTLWTTTLTQFAPSATVPFNLVSGEITILANGTFTLTIPTTLQSGSVVASLTIESGTQKIPFTSTVASWPLSS